MSTTASLGDSNNREGEVKEKSSPYLVPLSIVVAGVIISAAIFYRNENRDTLTASGVRTNVGQGAEEPVREVSEDDDPYLGNPDAKVVLIEFADFQCPFCGRFFSDALPQIKEQYVRTGKVKFVYRDFPLKSIHPDAVKAGEAAQCAHEQGKFWQYHDYLYEHQEALAVADLKGAAAAIGLDQAMFDECLDSGKYNAEVNKDYGDGVAAGVSGTPTTFVNGRPLVGAQPFAAFQQYIEEELKR
ncbi:MAG: DsbA family protein [bacterium]|nr:DsbA family protein [bacterium]MDZ4296658.1 DsbA family protein [Patescibacteria group bacterium]